MSVGMPETLLLNQFGQHITNVFGEIPYHVGSSLTGKTWRDVDVRLILPDEKYAAMDLGVVDYPHSNAKWRSLVLAWSAFGRHLTGLPIDFQIQQQTDANKKHKGPRSALFEREITEQDIIRPSEENL